MVFDDVVEVDFDVSLSMLLILVVNVCLEVVVFDVSGNGSFDLVLVILCFKCLGECLCLVVLMDVVCVVVVCVICVGMWLFVCLLCCVVILVVGWFYFILVFD